MTSKKKRGAINAPRLKKYDISMVLSFDAERPAVRFLLVSYMRDMIDFV